MQTLATPANKIQRRRLTEAQASRLINLLAAGPAERLPLDANLFALGWLRNYDGTSAVECVDGATDALYDEQGGIRLDLIPKAWLYGRLKNLMNEALGHLQAAENYYAMAGKNSNSPHEAEALQAMSAKLARIAEACK